MADEMVTVEAKLRTETGKGPARRLRSAGHVPAALHENGKVTLLALDPKWLPRACKTDAREFTMVLEGKSRKVRVSELQIHPVKRVALHVDLLPA